MQLKLLSIMILIIFACISPALSETATASKSKKVNLEKRALPSLAAIAKMIPWKYIIGKFVAKFGPKAKEKALSALGPKAVQTAESMAGPKGAKYAGMAVEKLGGYGDKLIEKHGKPSSFTDEVTSKAAKAGVGLGVLGAAMAAKNRFFKKTPQDSPAEADSTFAEKYPQNSYVRQPIMSNKQQRYRNIGFNVAPAA